MKPNKLFMAVAVLLCLAMLADGGFAQNKRIGTASSTQLLIPVGARGVALGGSQLANTKGVEAIYWNPAGLGRMHNSAEGMFSSMNYIADISVSHGGVAGTFGDFGTLGFAVTALDFGDIPMTTEDDPENLSERFYSPAFVTLSLGYGRGLTDAISVGFAVKIVSEQIARASASGFALDIGIQYSNLIGVSGLELGVALKNIGPQMKYDGPGLYRLATSGEGRRPEQRYRSEAASFELPSVVEIGLSYEGMVENNIMYGVNSTFTNNNLYLDEYKVGAEVGLKLEQLDLFGRVGMGFVPQAETDENIFGESFGLGIHYNAVGIDITVDYAYRAAEFFDGNNVFSVKFGF